MISVKVWKKAKKILNSPNKWTQKTGAKDKRGRKVLYNDKSATSFCLVSALFKASDDPLVYWPGLNLCELVSFNDSSSYKEVIAFIDKQIKCTK